MRRPLLAALLSLALVSCGRATVGQPGRTGATTSPPSGDRYLANTTVLESPEHGPSLCLGGILESLPPQCGDVPVTNWDWGQVDGEERMSGTTWGTYQVFGTYDGTSFTLTETPGPPDLARPDEEPIETPCPEPGGGWRVSDPSRVTQADFDAAQAWARQKPDFSGLWVDHIVPPAGESQEPANLILNAAFAGDLGPHKAELEARWGGALCLVRFERTFRELVRIQSELTPDGARDLGLHLLSSNVDEVDNVVEVFVVLVGPDTEGDLADRYGEGTVEISGALEPVG